MRVQKRKRGSGKNSSQKKAKVAAVAVEEPLVVLPDAPEFTENFILEPGAGSDEEILWL